MNVSEPRGVEERGGSGAAGARTTVAVYRRSIDASLERVWENVRDWEHLPWLHNGSFCSIECLDEGEWGWRARVGSQPEATGQHFSIELVIDAGAGRYVTRSLDGGGAGTEIWTQLTPAAEHRTDIEVEFQVPDVPPESADALGKVYLALYSTLWDEDEAMMAERQRALDARGLAGAGPAEVALGERSEVLARAPFCVEAGGRRYRVVAIDGELVAHATTCPHRLGPLEDARVEDGCVVCPWHGYRFDLRSGRSADGRGLRLAPAPKVRGGDTLKLSFDE